VHRGREKEVQQIFDKWDLPWAEIGFVTDTGQMIVKHNGKVVVDIPAAKLANEAPVYQRESREPAYLKQVRAFTLTGVEDTQNPTEDLKALLNTPSIASKNWVYRQYDFMVRDSTVVPPGSDAAVIHIKGNSLPQEISGNQKISKFIAMSVDCNATYVYLDPYEGGKIAVAEAARNLACSGAVPLGATDNLNFGNPHNPEIFFQLRKSVEGLSEACRVFNAPVTGGNVSLYNQNPNGPIDPTPTVALVGQIAKREHITTQFFKDEGDLIVLLGEAVDAGDPLLGLGGSAYLQRRKGLKTGTPPRINLEHEKQLHDTLRALITSGLVKSAHDCSEGGLAVAIAESCISQQTARETPRLIGATIDFTEVHSSRLDALLFGETQSRIVISIRPGDLQTVMTQCQKDKIPVREIGRVGGTNLSIQTARTKLEWPLAELHDLWWNCIRRAMEA
jgi:phosphoribosylformylglycinamidine synthase